MSGRSYPLDLSSESSIACFCRDQVPANLPALTAIIGSRTCCGELDSDEMRAAIVAESKASLTALSGQG